MKCKTLFFAATIFLTTALFAQNMRPTTIAIIGCHEQNREAPVIPYLAYKVKPDVTCWVGDNVYADTNTDPQHIQNQLDVLALKDGFQTLKENSAFMVTWDDHDYGLNNADINYIFKEESKAIHRAFWNLEPWVSETQQGIYHAKYLTAENGKTIQFIMLDTRFNKEKPGFKSTLLGEEQWSWLEKELKKPADLRIVLSGMQILLNRPTRWEAWTKQGKEKKRLMKLIKSTNAKGVVFITGDQHYVEVLKSSTALPYTAYEIMAAGINKTEVPGVAGKRVAGADKSVHNAPIMNVYWEGTKSFPKPHIHFYTVDVENVEVPLSYRIYFSEIGL